MLLKNKKKKKVYFFDLNPNQKVILIALKKPETNETEKSGAKLTDFLKNDGAAVVHIVSDTISVNLKQDAIYDFAWNEIKVVFFDKYKSKKESKF